MKTKNALLAVVVFFVAGLGLCEAKNDLVVKDCKFKTISVDGEKWGELRVRYTTQTDAKWLDKLTIDFYVATLPHAKISGIDNPKWTLFHKQVDYVDILDGNKEAVTFLHFSPMKRYFASASKGKYAVVFSVGGKMIKAIDSEKKPESKWWESEEFSAKNGYLMSRAESPFYASDTGTYEMIEPKGR